MTEKEFGLQNVKRPKPDQSSWYTIQQQSFTIDKDEFILERFTKDFPNMKIKDIKQFELVLSRSTKLQEWYQLTSLQFAESIQLPIAYKDLFKPGEYKKFFEDVQEYKSNLADESAEVELLSRKFSSDLSEIKEKYGSKNRKVIDKNKLYPILVLDGQKLPLSLQIEIEGYTPKTGEVTQQRSLYARELLINYKRALIEKVKTDPSVDVLELIESMRVK